MSIQEWGAWFEKLVLRHVGGKRVRNQKHDIMSNNQTRLQIKGSNFDKTNLKWHWKISVGEYDRLILVGRTPDDRYAFFDLPWPIKYRHHGIVLTFRKQDLNCNPRRRTPWWLWRYFPPCEPEVLTWRYYFQIRDGTTRSHVQKPALGVPTSQQSASPLVYAIMPPSLKLK
jgi:hypothetical protein